MKAKKILRITMSEETFNNLSRARKEKGFPGIGSYLLDLAGELTDDEESFDIVKKCRIRALRKAPSSKKFSLKSLFPEDTWNGFSAGARQKAGRLFFAEVQKGLDGIIAVRESDTNSQRYVRVPD